MNIIRIKENTMKLRKLLLLPVLFTTLLVGCGKTNPPVEPENEVTYTFGDLTEENYVQKLTKKGTRLSPESYVATAGFENVFKNNNFYVSESSTFRFLCRLDAEGAPNVWIRRIEFTFMDNKNGLKLIEADPAESYSDGVWTTTMTKGNQGTAEIKFQGTGEAIISKVKITTAPFVQDTVKLEINNLDSDDEVYFFSGGATFEKWQTKEKLKPDTEFFTLQTYYLWVNWGQNHKEYFEFLTMKNNGKLLPDKKFFPDPDSGLPQQEIVAYELQINEREAAKITISSIWTAKDASNNIKINTVSAIQYVKGFMETNPLESLGINNVLFGQEVYFDARPKKGYIDLRVTVNGKEASYDIETQRSKFIVPLQKEINISFSATEGDEETRGKTVITLTGADAEKGKLAYAIDNKEAYIFFIENENCPTAQLTKLFFKGVEIARQYREEEQIYYFKLNEEQTTVLEEAEDKASLFFLTIGESAIYTSTLCFNKGAFSVEVNGAPISEENFDVSGRSEVTLKVIPNEHLDIHSVEVNDIRITFTPNEDGSVTYKFTANAKKYEFLIQTKAQLVKLERDIDSTTGYIIKDLPSEASEVGKAITLTLGVTDESKYFLEGKDISVTYNGAKLVVDETNYSFVITPVKDVTKIKVIVTEKA